MTHNRQPAGVPVGGQFAATAHPESGVHLAATAQPSDVDDGLVPARPTTQCSHGESGYCADDATPEERKAVDFLHRHAYEWALKTQGDRDVAEEYAAWLVRDSWSPGAVDLSGAHPRDFERFEADRLRSR